MFLHTLRVISEIFRKIKNFIPEPRTYCAWRILKVIFLQESTVNTSGKILHKMHILSKYMTEFYGGFSPVCAVV